MAGYLPLLKILLLILGTKTHAGEALFGGEFTFENRATNKSWLNNSFALTTQETRNARDDMAAILIDRCRANGNCHVTRSPRRWLMGFDYVITYTDGWSFRISTDPGVVEIQTQPLTAKEFRSRSARIQQDIFDVATQAGLRPSSFGGGHIHMGVESAFNGNPTLFRNYFVDQVNHGEQGMGIFGSDIFNAPVIGDLSPDQQAEYLAVVREFDEGKILSIEDFSRAMQNRVYYRTTGEDQTPPRKHQHQNVTRIVDYAGKPSKQTIEDRTPRAQKNFDDFLLQIELKQARLDFLEGINGRVEAKIPKRDMGSWTKIKSFFGFVSESGKNWQDYRLFAGSPYIGETISYPTTQVLPHSERTRHDMQGKGWNRGTTNQCSLSFARLRNLFNPKTLLYFGY